MRIDNFTECDIELINDGGNNPDSTSECEELIFKEVDGDSQKFINIMTILANYYGDVSSEMITRWAR